MKRNFKIRIHFNNESYKNHLLLRHTISDTIESRGIGEVWNEGIGENYIELDVLVDYSLQLENEIKSLLDTFNLLPRSEIIIENMEE